MLSIRNIFRMAFSLFMLKLGYVPMAIGRREGWMVNGMNPNHILRGEGFHISYMPMNRDKFLLEDQRTGTKEKTETAIVFVTPGTDEVDEDGDPLNTYLILNGDHREEYEKRINDMSACLDYYQSKREEYGSWYSSDRERERKEANQE